METFAERIERQHLERMATERAVAVPQPILDKDACDICELCKQNLRHGEPVRRPTPSMGYFDTQGRQRHFWEHVECRQRADAAQIAAADRHVTPVHPDAVVRTLDERVAALEGKRR